MSIPIPDDRPVRWGILGAGGIAATVGADIAASAGSELLAVGSRDQARAAAFAARHGIPRSYGGYRGLVDDPDIDVVYVATPHSHHCEHALLALGAGKSVLVEKAFALNAREAREVVADARRRSLFCMEAMWMRLDPLVIAAVDRAAAGAVGQVTAVRADLSRRFAFDPAHRLFDLALGGGALLDLGIYPLHFVWAVLGEPSGTAATGVLSPTGSDLVTGLQLSYPGGEVGQVLTSAVGTSPDTGLILGTEGWIRLAPRLHRAETVTISGDGSEEVLAGSRQGNGYLPQVAEVERCLRAGLLESPRLPLDETVAILEVMDEARAQLGVVYPADRRPGPAGGW